MKSTTMLLIGILAVILIVIFTVRIRTAPKKDEQTEQANAAAPVAPTAPQPTAAALPTVEAGIPPQVVAAIIAAIEAASDGSALRFVAIRRSQTVRNVWNSSGTQEIIANRQQYL